MNRDTKFLLGVLITLSVFALIGLVVVSGGNGTSPQQDQSPVNDTTVSEEVEDVYPLALELDMQMNGYFNDVEVYVSNEGEIAMRYRTNAEAGEELKKEMQRIAVEYASISNETSVNPPTLSIISGNVQMVVPEPTVKSYTNGDINKEAFIKTLEVIKVENNSGN